jgi:hypothetical protein
VVCWFAKLGAVCWFALRSPESTGSCPDAVTAVWPPSPGVGVSCGALFAASVASSWTSDAGLDPLTVQALPAAAGPPHLATEVHSPVETIPSRVLRYLPAVRLASRTDFPELSGPFNDITRASPV